MTAVTTAIRPINIISGVILARLLAPGDFGLVALAMILLSATSLFSGLGMGPALIYTKLENKRVSFPAFLVSTVVSILLFAVVFLFAPFWANVLGDPDVEPVVRVLSTLIILNTLSIIPSAILRKDMKFGQVSKANLMAEIVNTTLSLTMAFLGYGYWSLVFGKISASATRIILLWRACPGWDWITPRRWRRDDLREMLRYGLQNTSSGFLSFFNSNWDDWLVARVLGTVSLGFYSKAYNLTNKSIAGFNRKVMSGVFFPSYAKIQDDKHRLARLYIKKLSMVALLMSPVAMGLFIIAPEGVPIVLGQKWVPMIPALQIFAFMALVRPLSGSTSPLFQAMGKPNYNVRVGLVLTAVMVPLVLLLLSYGIAGVATAVTAAYVVGFIFNIYQVNKLLPGTGPKMFTAILPALFASILMMIGVQLAKAPLSQLAGGQHNLLTLSVLVLIGAAIYLLVAFLIQRALIKETISLMLSVIKQRQQQRRIKPVSG